VQLSDQRSKEADIREKEVKREELKHMLGELVQDNKLSKRKLASMILSTVKDHETPKEKRNAVKILIKTFLKAGSLIPRTFDPEKLLSL